MEVEAEPRACERCETPHHPECWEYVPGCAVFGCAEGEAAALSTEHWPELYKEVLRGMGWISAATMSLQAMVLSFALLILGITFNGGTPPLLLALLFPVTIVATLGSMLAAFRVKWRIQAMQGYEALQELSEEGDRHLSRAVTERTGRTLPISPWVATALVSVLTVGPMVLVASFVGKGDGEIAALAAAVILALYAALELPERWVGYQRILANRLRSAIEARQPDKELPRGDEGK